MILEEAILGAQAIAEATQEARVAAAFDTTTKIQFFVLLTGRIPNSKGLNLEGAGVELDSTGAIKVDEYSRTNIPSIWAGGDVTNKMNLTPVAFMEGTRFRFTDNILYAMLENLSPSFMRFPGGTYVQGKLEENRFRWKESIGPWENRSGHVNDNWHYWTDDALGYYELLLLAEDLGATPIWVFNVGMGADDSPLIKAEDVYKYVQVNGNLLDFSSH